MRLAHRVRTTASPEQVWEVLGDPCRWPECELLLRRVRGDVAQVRTGQHLVGILRLGRLGLPLDVLEAVPGERLVVRARTIPGIAEELTIVLTPTTRGGTEVRVSVVVDGLLAGAALPTAWLAAGLTARVLARRTARDSRRARRAAVA